MSITSVCVFAENPINIIVGREKLVTDVNPVIVNGRTLVPLRAIFEALDATVEWNNDTRTVTATKDDTVISLVIGEDVMRVNGTEVKLDVAAQLVEGRTMIPVRAVSEALDCEVNWNNDTRTVIIKKDVWKVSSAEFCNVYTDDSVWYQWEEYTYNEDGSVLVDVSGGETPDDKGIGERWISIMTYDEYGNLVKEGEVDPETNQETVLKEYAYVYENGLLIQDPYKKYSYDNNGRLIKMENLENGQCVEYEYDSDNNLICEKGANYIYEYFYENGKLDYCDHNNGYELIEYDYWGDTLVEYSMDDNEDEWVTIRHEYLNPKDVSYELEYISYDLDEEGRLVEIEYDNEEDWAFSTKITYDENGNISFIEDSNDGYTKYEYVKVKW